MCVLEIFYSPKPDIWDQKGIKNDIKEFYFSFHWYFNKNYSYILMYN